MPTAPEYRAAAEKEDATLREYAGILWRRKWVVILVTLIATAGAFGISWSQASVYEAQADLIYEQQLDVSNPLTGQSYADPEQRFMELSAVNALVLSPTIAQRATTALEEQDMPTSGYEVRAEIVPDASGGTEQSNVVAVIATSNDSEHAAAVAQAYADEFVDWRQERMLNQIDAAEKAVKAEIREYPEAARESSDYVILQQRLRDLQILAATATGNFRVLVPAAVPAEPAQPQPLRSAALGFGIGLLVGIGVAFLLEQFDTRLRRPEDVAEALGQPVLARIPRLSREQTKSPTLVTLAHPGDRVAEAFRLMRTNLAFMDVDGAVKSILVTSSLQGEGKSVTVANLAVTLALAGKRVVIVDADLRRPRQHRLFDLPNAVGASSVAVGEADLLAALRPVDLVSGNGDGTIDFASWKTASDGPDRLWVLTSGPMPPNPGEIVASRRFAQILKTLRGEADFVLVDSPAMLAVGDTAALASEVDGLVFLVDMEKARRPVLQAAADQLYRLPCAMMGLAIRLQGGGHGDRYHYRYVQDDEPRRNAAVVGTLAPGPDVAASADVTPAPLH